MDIFTKRIFLIRTLILMVVLNLSFIAYFFFLKQGGNTNIIDESGPLLFPKNEGYRDMTPILKRELKLTDSQVIRFNVVRKSNFEKQVVLSRINRDLKDSLNVNFYRINTDEELVLTLIKKISENVLQNELLRYAQAKELKSICTKEQQERFDLLVKEIRDFFRPDNQPINK